MLHITNGFWAKIVLSKKHKWVKILEGNINFLPFSPLELLTWNVLLKTYITLYVICEQCGLNVIYTNPSFEITAQIHTNRGAVICAFKPHQIQASLSCWEKNIYSSIQFRVVRSPDNDMVSKNKHSILSLSLSFNLFFFHSKKTLTHFVPLLISMDIKTDK